MGRKLQANISQIDLAHKFIKDNKFINKTFKIVYKECKGGNAKAIYLLAYIFNTGYGNNRVDKIYASKLYAYAFDKLLQLHYNKDYLATNFIAHYYFEGINPCKKDLLQAEKLFLKCVQENNDLDACTCLIKIAKETSQKDKVKTYNIIFNEIKKGDNISLNNYFDDVSIASKNEDETNLNISSSNENKIYDDVSSSSNVQKDTNDTTKDSESENQEKHSHNDTIFSVQEKNDESIENSNELLEMNITHENIENNDSQKSIDNVEQNISDYNYVPDNSPYDSSKDASNKTEDIIKDDVTSENEMFSKYETYNAIDKFNEAIKLMNENDPSSTNIVKYLFDSSFNEMSGLCDEGNIIAFRYTGLFYLNGYGSCEVDVPTAMAYFEKASQLGDEISTNIVSDYYKNTYLTKASSQAVSIENKFYSIMKKFDRYNDGILHAVNSFLSEKETKDEVYAHLHVLMILSKQHNIDAMLLLGYIYGNYDKYDVKNLSKSLYYYDMAEKCGSIQAKYHLGLIYMDEKSPYYDITKGMTYMHKAGRKGCPESLDFLGQYYLKRTDIISHDRIARRFFELSAIRGLGKAYYHLYLLEESKGNSISADSYYRRANELGYTIGKGQDYLIEKLLPISVQ